MVCPDSAGSTELSTSERDETIRNRERRRCVAVPSVLSHQKLKSTPVARVISQELPYVRDQLIFFPRHVPVIWAVIGA